MLTGLKGSSFLCKCVFYRPEYNPKGGESIEMNFKGLQIQKRNILTGRAHGADDKN